MYRSVLCRALSSPFRIDLSRDCRNEEPFLKSFFDEGNYAQQVPSISLKAIFRCGLVAKHGAGWFFARDSADAVGVYEQNGGVQHLTIEVKTRVSDENVCDARQIRLNIGSRSGIASINEMSNDVAYVEVQSSDSRVLNSFIPDEPERLQLLHHAFVYGCTCSILLVGDKEKLLYGVILHFASELLDSYASVAAYIFENYIMQFYGPEEDQPSKKVVEDTLEMPSMVTKKMDYQAYCTNLAIWRYMNVNGLIDFPVPPCSRVIPLQHAFWNNLKPVSDTFTRNADSCEERLGSLLSSPQTKAHARILKHSCNAYFRARQIMSSNADLFKYKTLGHWQDAASHRLTFQRALLELKQNFEIGDLLIRDEHAVLAAAESAAASPRMQRLTRAGVQVKKDFVFCRGHHAR